MPFLQRSCVSKPSAVIALIVATAVCVPVPVPVPVPGAGGHASDHAVGVMGRIVECVFSHSLCLLLPVLASFLSVPCTLCDFS